MSRIYFQSPSGKAELHGSERAHMSLVARDVTLSFVTDSAMERIVNSLPPDHYLHFIKSDQKEYLQKSFTAWWTANGEDPIRIPTPPTTPWLLSLNTMVALRSDPLELLARIHATCEIHGYVEPEHRNWLADIIYTGRSENILRAGMGWEDVESLLRTQDGHAVVMSYSVTCSFPCFHHSTAFPVESRGKHWSAQTLEERGNIETCEKMWDELPEHTRWKDCMDWLRLERDVDLSPTIWHERRFGDQIWSVFNLIDHIDQEG